MIDGQRHVINSSHVGGVMLTSRRSRRRSRKGEQRGREERQDQNLL